MSQIAESLEKTLGESLESVDQSGEGLFRSGRDGVRSILTSGDGKADFIIFDDKVLVYVGSSLGHPAVYRWLPVEFNPPAKALLMDLDGTSVRSEEFWIWIIEGSIAKLMGDPHFQLSSEDLPYVSGHSVTEHLSYCITKYCPDQDLKSARDCYDQVSRFELAEISKGRGRVGAFRPSPGLKEFLLEMKGQGIRLGLVTSGLYEKAWPEILSAFGSLNLGDPVDFYDCIITAGAKVGNGQVGTLGELSPKPHPWLYAEAARVGLGVLRSDDSRVMGIEDSGAGVLSVRLAGFSVAGISGGNIVASGARPFLSHYVEELTDLIPVVLGRE